MGAQSTRSIGLKLNNEGAGSVESWESPRAHSGFGAMPPMTENYPAQSPVFPARIASMGARFGGLVIDTLVVGAVTALLSWPLGLFSKHHDVVCSDSGRCISRTTVTLGPGGILLATVLGIAYSALLVGISGRTLGHRVAGIKVVHNETGNPIGVLRGAWRWLVMVVTGAVVTLGYWSPFFDKDRRGWLDKASSAIVIGVR